MLKLGSTAAQRRLPWNRLVGYWISLQCKPVDVPPPICSGVEGEEVVKDNVGPVLFATPDHEAPVCLKEEL